MGMGWVPPTLGLQAGVSSVPWQPLPPLLSQHLSWPDMTWMLLNTSILLPENKTLEGVTGWGLLTAEVNPTSF